MVLHQLQNVIENPDGGKHVWSFCWKSRSRRALHARRVLCMSVV